MQAAIRLVALGQVVISHFGGRIVRLPLLVGQKLVGKLELVQVLAVEMLLSGGTSVRFQGQLQRVQLVRPRSRQVRCFIRVQLRHEICICNRNFKEKSDDLKGKILAFASYPCGMLGRGPPPLHVGDYSGVPNSSPQMGKATQYAHCTESGVAGGGQSPDTVLCKAFCFGCGGEKGWPPSASIGSGRRAFCIVRLRVRFSVAFAGALAELIVLLCWSSIDCAISSVRAMYCGLNPINAMQVTMENIIIMINIITIDAALADAGAL